MPRSTSLATQLYLSLHKANLLIERKVSTRTPKKSITLKHQMRYFIHLEGILINPFKKFVLSKSLFICESGKKHSLMPKYPL